MVKMKGGAEGWVIGIILLIVVIVIIVIVLLVIEFKCTKVTKTCEDDDDCCKSLKCVGTKCCSPSTEKCSKDNECCGTLKCKDKKCTEPAPDPVYYKCNGSNCIEDDSGGTEYEDDNTCANKCNGNGRNG